MLWKTTTKLVGLRQAPGSGTVGISEDPEIAGGEEDLAGEDHGTSEGDRTAGQRKERNSEGSGQTGEGQERAAEDT